MVTLSLHLNRESLDCGDYQGAKGSKEFKDRWGLLVLQVLPDSQGHW